jgi:nitrogen fixation/metabolism regulation signal transduction histidine kinase
MTGYDILALGIGAVVILGLAVVISGTVLAVSKAKRDGKP